MKDLILLLLSFIFYTSALSAQETAEFNFFPEPGPLPSFLSDLAGEWDVSFKKSDEPEVTIRGSWEEVLGGSRLMGKFNGPDSVEFMVITGYNSWDKIYFISVFGSKTGAPIHLEGIYNDSTRTIVINEYRLNIMFTDHDNLTWEFLTTKGERYSSIKFNRIK